MIKFDQFIYYVEGIRTHEWDELRKQIPEIAATKASLAKELKLEKSDFWCGLDVSSPTWSTVAIELEQSPIDPSFCWDRDGIPATVVDDVLTAISLVKCVLVGTLKAMFSHDKSIKIARSIGREEPPPLGGVFQAGSQSHTNLIVETFQALRNAGPHAFDSLGLGTSIEWHRQAQVARSTALTITEIALYWTTLEVFGTFGLTESQSRSIKNEKL